MPKQSRRQANKALKPGVNMYSRTANAKRSMRHRYAKKVEKTVTPAPEKERVTMIGKWYDADNAKMRLNRRTTPGTAKLRASITPGTVLVLLAGRFRGKRVVFLKQLDSGLLLVTGPFKINGVPLRRVNQAYVIATTTKLDVSKVKVPSHVNDAYFKRAALKSASEEEEFYSQAAVSAVVSDKRKADQKSVDSQLLPIVAGTEFMRQYLNAKFSLRSSDRPHEMSF